MTCQVVKEFTEADFFLRDYRVINVILKSKLARLLTQGERGGGRGQLPTSNDQDYDCCNIASEHFLAFSNTNT